MSDAKSQSTSQSKSESDNNSSMGIVVEHPLKFNFHQCADPGIDLSAQNKLSFDLADTFSQVDSSAVRHLEHQLERSTQHEHAVQNRLLEKKLNLVMQLLNTLLINMSGSAMTHSLKLSANTVEWDNAQFQNEVAFSIEKDQNLLFDFYPASELPYPIKRSGVVVGVNGSIISVKFYPLDALNQERFEKWVFQLHRRSLQHKDH